MLIIGFVLVINGQMTLGMLLAAQTIAFGLKGEIEKLIGFVQKLPQFESELLRLEDVLEQPRDPLLTAKTSLVEGSSTQLSGSIEIRNLSYGFVAIKPPLIDDLNLSIAPGMRIALVGGSGSGKSTLAKLIAGLHQPTAGEILFDGRPLVAIPRRTGVASLAMVQQDIQLFGCTVRENLSLWNPTTDDRELMQACRDAEVLDVVRALPDGFDTELSEGGKNLSGGQRQRLEIARALVSNPSILIMDEATSALDAATELNVMANISRRGCTQVIVAHRLSTIRDADLILVMDQGNVIQRGNHNELIKSPEGAYAQLLQENN